MGKKIKEGKHGGTRPGAGRKKIREQFCFQIDLDLTDKIRGLADRNNFVNSAIRKEFERLESRS